MSLVLFCKILTRSDVWFERYAQSHKTSQQIFEGQIQTKFTDFARVKYDFTSF
jgi:hypothetical protein